MGRDKTEMETKMNEFLAQQDVLKIELQTEREKNEELKGRIKEVESERKDKKKKPSITDSEPLEENVQETSDKYENKIKDLQTRLKRMAKDEEEKDEHNQNLEKQLRSKDEHIKRLEEHVDKVKVEEIRASQQEQYQNNQESNAPIENNEYNVVGKPDVRASKTCTIV